MSNKKAIIIGAGLTGLTTAYYLKKAGWDVTVLEKEKEVGGAMKTVYENGFTFESGANTGVLGNPETAELFDELAPQAQLEIADPDAKKRLILKKGKFHALPSGLFGAVFTPLFTLYDKFRILGEPFRKKGTNPYETVAQITRRRMGRSFLDYAMDPFVSGIYAGDPERLVIRFALPKMWALENKYGSFVKGGIKRSKEMHSDERMKRATRDVMSAYGGFGKLVNALADKLGRENIMLGVQNIHVIKPDSEPGVFYNKWSVSFIKDKVCQYPADYVITTVHAHALPQMLDFLSPEQLQGITNVEYAKIINVSLGFNKWTGPDIKAFGGLIPSKENRKILGVLYSSSFLKDRAPQGGALMTVYMGGIRHSEVMDLTDDEIQSIVINELRETLHYPQLQPDVVKIFRHPYAIPQYYGNTEQRLQMVDEVQAQYPGLIIAGNLRNGIGMADRIKQARDIAEQLIDVSSCICASNCIAYEKVIEKLQSEGFSPKVKRLEKIPADIIQWKNENNVETDIFQTDIAIEGNKVAWFQRDKHDNFLLRVFDGKTSFDWTPETYNPIFGCLCLLLEWYKEHLIFIYQEKHDIYICSIKNEQVRYFNFHGDEMERKGNIISYETYMNKEKDKVRLIQIPELIELPPIDKDEAEKLGLTPQGLYRSGNFLGKNYYL